MPLPPMDDLKLEGFWGSLIQASVLIFGGLWGYYLYRRRRPFKPRIRTTASARLAPITDQAPARLFIRLHVVNESGAHMKANARIVLWAVKQGEGQFPTFEERDRDFPFDYVYGTVQPTTRIMAGEDGASVSDVELESAECIETEVLFSFAPLPDLMAVRATVEEERTLHNWPWFWRSLVGGVRWESFAYLDPAALSGSEYVAITSHAAAE